MLLHEFINTEAATQLYNELKSFGDILMSPSAYERTSLEGISFRKMSCVEEEFLDIYDYLISDEVKGATMIKKFQGEIIGVAKWCNDVFIGLEWEPFHTFDVITWHEIIKSNPEFDKGQYDLMSRIAFGTWKKRAYNIRGEMILDSYVDSLFWFKHTIENGIHSDLITLNRVRENYISKAKEEFEKYFSEYEKAHKPKVYSDYSSRGGDDEYVDEYYDAFGSW